MGGDDMPVYAYQSPPNTAYAVTEFVGVFFSCGLACGSAFHFVRGLCSSPRGARLAGAVRAVSTHAPRVAGKFSAYFVAFSAIENGIALVRRRGRLDIWPSITAGAMLGALDGMRRGGAPAAARCALLGVAGISALLANDHARMVRDSNAMVNHAHPVHIAAPRQPAFPVLRGNNPNPMDMDYW